MTLQQKISLFLILEILTINIPFFILGGVFEFPDILRQPAAYVLPLFREHQAIIVPAYYIFMVSGLLFIPLSAGLKVYLDKVSPEKPFSASMMFSAGIATAVFQTIGFCRWLILMPFLSDQYAMGDGRMDSIALLYETFNRYAGMTIGEHLGFIALTVWIISLALAWNGNTWFKRSGILIGLMMGFSAIEPFGGSLAEIAGLMNLLANILGVVWLLWLAVILIRKT